MFFCSPLLSERNYAEILLEYCATYCEIMPGCLQNLGKTMTVLTVNCEVSLNAMKLRNKNFNLAHRILMPWQHEALNLCFLLFSFLNKQL
jgi:hypothetical protein